MANAGAKLWLGNQDALSGDYHIIEPIAFGAQNSASQSDGVSTEVVATLDKSKTPAVAGTFKARAGSGVWSNSADHAAAGYMIPVTQTSVRRLTPRECERLQGFPDDYTLTPHRGKPAADGPRYKALGNSMAVPVMRWIGDRIHHVDQLNTEAKP
jgi:DNA (cytosine-5)-methyltransferase 1